MIKYAWILVICGFFLVQAESPSVSPRFIPLPHSLGQKAVYHKRVAQLDEFSCGYNVLFNACNLERACNIPNHFSEYTPFKKTCMAFIAHNRLTAQGSSRNDHLEEIAHKHLAMPRFYALGFDDDQQVTGLFSTDTRITYFGTISQREKELKFKQARKERTLALLSDIRRYLDNNRNGSVLVHFVCLVKIRRDSAHWILISLVQNRSGRGLYIFDNTNEPITEGSHAYRYLLFLDEMLSISSKKYFKEPRLPDIWRSMPQPKIRATRGRQEELLDEDYYYLRGLCEE